MEIKTKYAVNDLVKHKYQSIQLNGDDLCYEVLEIKTHTCYAGTQVFYDCRAIVKQIEKEPFSLEVKPEGKYSIGFSIARDTNSMGTEKFREDELIDCDEQLKNQILNR